MTSDVSAGGIGVVPTAIQLAAYQNKGASKQAGGAASQCEIRTEQIGAALVGGILSLSISPQVSQAFKFSSPVVLRPGFGLSVYGNNNNGANVSASFEYYEEFI